MTEFNLKLCEERHSKLHEIEIEIFTRLKKVENRFLAIMTTLALNLVGVVLTLLVILSRR